MIDNHLPFDVFVRNLVKGEHASKTRRIVDLEQLPETKQRLRNTCTTACQRATKMTGMKYRTEVGEVVMPAGTFYVVAVITCEGTPQ